MSWDPYAALGLKKGADAAAVKKAYRKLAKENHPDVRPNDPAAEETFKRATAAFNLLSDPDQKARYDRGEIDAEGQEKARFTGGHPFGQSAGGGSPFGNAEFRTHSYGGGGRGEPGADGFEDLFSGLFGGGQRRRQATRGQDARYVVDVDFMDAITGATRRLPMSDGKVLDVTIPAGVKSGQTLRLRSQGHPGVGGAPPGDALIEVRVKDHPNFKRDGDNLRLTLPISLTEAVEGGKVEVPTPLGRKSLNVPAGAKGGSTLRMKKHGVQKKSEPGDLYVTLQIVLPDKDLSGLKDFVKNWDHRDYVPPRP
ncbi:DnaJ C-terminal domain-containing protein [Ponticaulis sp.]|uniref:DnaJ C-terminal domain-containing protein n=1 Tax=Ponticaulis sp. TaxID=2020902 RepID=UPI000B62832F|nr:DnaJ C-terminal domain-containing protein [Ponticaulis sp.]MAI90416.1 molecular chaperone DnaJ [Ponticaulis sp.]OUY00117.1 MAG: molecular chaperone DnaJ [Hyphomonadaceae bacterium TMED5]